MLTKLKLPTSIFILLVELVNFVSFEPIIVAKQTGFGPSYNAISFSFI
jgi:hypothetical protein